MTATCMRSPSGSDGPGLGTGASAYGGRNVRGGLILLSVGLFLGLLMSLYAFEPMVQPPAGLEHYDDLPRRLARLAHIAAIMLPLLNVAIGGWLDRLSLSRRSKQIASLCLLCGAVALPLALGIEAVSATARGWRLSALPAIVFCWGVFVTSVGAARTPGLATVLKTDI
jgi:hypothetical protein